MTTEHLAFAENIGNLLSDTKLAGFASLGKESNLIRKENKAQGIDRRFRKALIRLLYLKVKFLRSFMFDFLANWHTQHVGRYLSRIEKFSSLQRCGSSEMLVHHQNGEITGTKRERM